VNAFDIADKLENKIRSCPCDGDCSSCELSQQCLEEITKLREALNRISCIAHPELHKNVYRGA